MKKILILLLLINAAQLPFSLFAQSESEKTADDNPAAEDEDSRRDILRYGIDSEVINLLNSLKQQEDHGLDKEVLSIAENTRNGDLQQAALKLLIESDDVNPVPVARKILEDYPLDEKLINSALDVIGKKESRDDADLVVEYLRHENSVVGVKAMETIGIIGTTEYTAVVRDIYEDTDTSQSVRAAALSTLGALKDEDSIDFLVDILEDTTQEKSYRWRACQALGSYGTAQVLPHIQNALHDDDTILRTYAVRALKEFPADLVLDDLREALRDSFWRVRVAAIETLGEREEKDAVDVLIYKAKRDPEEKIRLTAVIALGKIGGGKAFDALREIAEARTFSMALRAASIQVVLDKDIASSFSMIDTIIEQEWEKDKSPLFIELVKGMTRQEHERLAGYFERFLTYNDVSVILMTLKGIEKNAFFTLKDTVQELSESLTANSVKKMAEEVLDSL